MILNAIFLVLQAVLNILLLPLSVLNIVIDITSSIPIVSSFLQVVAYVVPWDNILPLIFIVFSYFIFRIGMSIIKVIINIIPFF